MRRRLNMQACVLSAKIMKFINYISTERGGGGVESGVQTGGQSTCTGVAGFSAASLSGQSEGQFYVSVYISVCVCAKQ